MDLDATVRAQLEAAAASQDIAVEDKRAKAEKLIWAAVALSAGMGGVPFGINFGFFIAVSGGLVVCLGELYGYIYTKQEAAALVVQLFKSCGLTWTATAFGLKFMAEVLKVSGVVTMGVATPAGMALDAVLCGAVTYAVGFTTLRYLERNRELPAEVMRTEFRTRFTEGMAILREQARQRSAELSTELSTEARARYDTAARQLKESADVLREQARQRGTVLGAEFRARYDTTARQLKVNADGLREQARQRVARIRE
jgi:uncharacterized protein (DUF697 family)